MIKIITIGKIKEAYLKDGIKDYISRINKYHKTEIIELKESNTDDVNKNLKNEATDIMKYIKTNNYVIICDLDGTSLDTINLSKKINLGLTNYQGDIIFIIGSTHGIHSSVKNKANLRLSFSKLTFPHGLFRIILVEQIYRAFKILNNESYHK